jgi:hypothetical protein
LIAALQAAAGRNRQLGSDAYLEWRLVQLGHGVKVPSLPTILARWPWRVACAKAGLVPVKRFWTDAEISAAVRSAAGAASSLTRDKYASWAHDGADNERPSANTVQRRLGIASWDRPIDVSPPPRARRSAGRL